MEEEHTGQYRTGNAQADIWIPLLEEIITIYIYSKSSIRYYIYQYKVLCNAIKCYKYKLAKTESQFQFNINIPQRWPWSVLVYISIILKLWTLNNMALTAVSRFIRSIPTVVHRVTLPPERDTLICPTAKLEVQIQNKNRIWGQHEYFTRFSFNILQSQSQNQYQYTTISFEYMSEEEKLWEWSNLARREKKQEKHGQIEAGSGRGSWLTWLEVQLERHVLLSAAK